MKRLLDGMVRFSILGMKVRMNRWLLLTLIAGAFFYPTLGARTESQSDLPASQVELRPEYDQPSMLVICDFRLPGRHQIAGRFSHSTPQGGKFLRGRFAGCRWQPAQRRPRGTHRRRYLANNHAADPELRPRTSLSTTSPCPRPETCVNSPTCGPATMGWMTLASASAYPLTQPT